MLDTVGSQWSAAADRIRQLPARVTAAGQQLHDTANAAGQQLHDTANADAPPADVTRATDPTPAAARQWQHDTHTTARQWQHAAEQLDLMAECLTSAVAALGSYTGGLSGAGHAVR
ncbi:hypothetical protein ACQP1S_29225 [Micromonospora matsumotoense]|uniref:hypothetical protein n=1 Tax=Micromonospora matsumotoense TaxID=121616 RepID=UPI003D9324F1